jgi:hypothetical protein
MRYLKILVSLAVVSLMAVTTIGSAYAAGSRGCRCDCDSVNGDVTNANTPAPTATANAPETTRNGRVYSYEPNSYQPTYRTRSNSSNGLNSNGAWDALTPLRMKGVVR